MKRKVGDIVTIKSINWYNENKNNHNLVECGSDLFTYDMIIYCSKKAQIVEIINDRCYRLSIDSLKWNWTDEMFENSIPKLRPGTVIECANKELYLILKIGSNLVACNINTSFILSDSIDEGNCLNITAIYEIINYDPLSILLDIEFKNVYLKLIWEK